MQRFLIRLVLVSLAVVVASALFPPRLRVDSYEAAVLFALVLAVCNVLVRPVLLLITLPLNIVTLGLFTLVVNGLVFWLATVAPVGVEVDGFGGAFLGALAVSVASLIAGRIGRGDG